LSRKLAEKALAGAQGYTKTCADGGEHRSGKIRLLGCTG
jgi:hypothetical protein